MHVDCPANHNKSKYGTGCDINSLLDGSYEVSAPELSEIYDLKTDSFISAYKCKITIKNDWYGKYIDMLKGLTGVDHTYHSQNNNQSVDYSLRYDASAGEWTFVDSGTCTIYAVCPPDKSVAGEWDLEITCGECEKTRSDGIYSRRLALKKGDFSSAR